MWNRLLFYLKIPHSKAETALAKHFHKYQYLSASFIIVFCYHSFFLRLWIQRCQ